MKGVYCEEENYRMGFMAITGCNVEFWVPKSLSNGILTDKTMIFCLLIAGNDTKFEGVILCTPKGGAT